MHHLDPALSSARAELEAVRARRAELDRRRADLDRRRADLEKAEGDLTITLRVLEGLAAQPAAKTASAASSPLADRVLAEVLEAGSTTRADLIQRFGSLDVKIDTLDSAIRRLVERGALRRDGRQLFPVLDGRAAVPPVPAAETPAETPDPAAVAAVDGETADPGAGGPGRRPIVTEVFDALVKLGPCTREALIRHCGERGVTDRQVRRALKGLAASGKLVRRDDGMLIAAGPDAPPSSARPGGPAGGAAAAENAPGA